MDFSDWWLRHLLWNCPDMYVTGLHWWSVDIGSGNGLMPSGNKSLPEPMLTQISVTIWRYWDAIHKKVSVTASHRVMRLWLLLVTLSWCPVTSLWPQVWEPGHQGWLEICMCHEWSWSSDQWCWIMSQQDWATMSGGLMGTGEIGVIKVLK